MTLEDRNLPARIDDSASRAQPNGAGRVESDTFDLVRSLNKQLPYTSATTKKYPWLTRLTNHFVNQENVELIYP